MTIKSDKWIKEMANNHDMINPFVDQQIRKRNQEKQLLQIIQTSHTLPKNITIQMK